MRNIDFTGIAYLAGGALVAYVVYWAWQNRSVATKAAAAIGAAVNPLSTSNLVYQAASAGTGSGSLGATIWEWFHPGAVAAENSSPAPLQPAAVDLSNYWTQRENGAAWIVG